MIAQLHNNVATDSGDERETAQAAANLWSGFGYLDARADVLRMVVGAPSGRGFAGQVFGTGA
ncbi:hypothetical protein AB0B57_04180 [Micromonospora sp. NPDC049101]|uniref:hypothetical protein n=1 Tax=Micromonospora sp. NPDC049101 TaxID=3155032 RepID=UPI0033F04B86